MLIVMQIVHCVIFSLYDGCGSLINETVADVADPQTVAYVWDGYNIVRELALSNDAPSVTENIWGLDLDGTVQGAGGVGGLLAVSRDGSAFLAAYDANGNVAEYVGAADGSVAAHYGYTPFGGIAAQSGVLAGTFTHRFSTKPWCGVTGLCEYQFRKYSPELGRWMSRDPIGEKNSNVPNDTHEDFLVEEINRAKTIIRSFSFLEHIFDISLNKMSFDIDQFIFAGERMQVGARNIFDLQDEYKNLYLSLGNRIPNETDYLGFSSLSIALPAAGTCALIDGPLPFGDFVAMTILGCCVVSELNKPHGCYPCNPSKGSGAYRIDYVPPGKPHWPFKGTHTHHYEMHQSPWPMCRCFWGKTRITNGATTFPGEIPVRDAEGGGAY